MHAIRQHEFGAADTLRFEDVADPEPAAGQVVIAVAAAGVHFVDTAIRRGEMRGRFPHPDLPMVPGREVAGTVASVGPGVDGGWAGRRVVAHLGMGGGGYAERAVASVDGLYELPADLADDAAVATIGTGRTAVGIINVAALSAGDVVLVLAAAGGLGTLFVQAARGVGATVVGAAGGPAKVERVRELGADVAVDYREPDWPDRVRAALGDRAPSVVLDGVGGALGRAAFDLLGVGGRLVVFGAAAGAPTAVTTEDLMGRGLTVTAIGPRILSRLRELEARALAEVAAGRLAPLVGQRFALADAAAAHEAVETRATVGKTVLVP